MHHLRLFLGIAGYILLFFLVPAVGVLLIWGVLHLFEVSLSSLTNEFLGDIVSLVFVVWFFGIYRKEIFKKLFPALPKLKRILLLLGISVLTRVLILLAVFVGLIVIWIFTDQETVDRVINVFTGGKDFQWNIFQKATEWEYTLGIISIVLFAPVIEELLLRGVIFNKLKKSYSLKVSIVYTNILFMLLHFHPGLFPVTFVFGVAMTLVYVKWNNLAYAMILHSFFNIQPFILEYLSKK